MRDFLPEDVRRREHVIGVIADVYQRYGFEPLETPAVENIETLLGKYGEEGDKLIFKILKRGEAESSGVADLALRYDLTVPLARVVAEHRAKLPKFFKRYQVQPVWRADRPQKGRFREFFQCDVDAIGSTSMVVETEILAAASEVLARLGFGEFRIAINHRQLLSALLRGCGVPLERQDDAMVALDKIDKIGRDGVGGELKDRGFEASTITRLLESLEPGGHDRLDWIERRCPLDDSGRAAIRDLRDIVRLSEHSSAAPHIEVEPTLARGLSYYTGAVFEVTVPDLAGSLAGGGRYDNLIGMFLGEEVPACGISLGLERILVVMGERNMFPSSVELPPADVLMVMFEQECTPEVLALSAAIRAGFDDRRVRVEVYPEPDKIGKQIKYASSRRIPFVALAGETERRDGTVAIKNLKTGQQEVISQATAARYLVEELRKARG
jgi:histidyl-tRNA synthetase